MTRAEFRTTREALGLTQQQLANRLGLTTTSVYRKEAGLQVVTERDRLSLRALTQK